MAKQRPSVSDNPTFEALTYAPPEFSPVAEAGADPGLVLANVVFRTAVPVDIESVPIDELIKFRVDFEGERVSFYDPTCRLGILSSPHARSLVSPPKRRGAGSQAHRVDMASAHRTT